MTFPFGQTVTLISRSVTSQDAYGNDVYTETETDLDGVPVWPRSSTENVQGEDQVVTGLTALLPPATDVAAVDAVIVTGDRYEITGDPGTYVSPFSGLNPGIEVNLQKVSG